MVQDTLAAAFANASALEWEERLSPLGVPAGKVRGLAEIMDSDQLAARGMIHTVADPDLGRDYRVPGVGCQMAHDGAAVTAPPPRLGQNTDAVLAELGYDDDKIAELRSDNVVA